jgi:hypothetical protein
MAQYLENRKTRSRIDLRGKTLTRGDYGTIVEFEIALQQFWAERQDSPDEIVVDSLTAFRETIFGSINPEATIHRDGMNPVPARLLGPDDVQHIYRTKWSVHPSGQRSYIPVFDNI